MDPITTGSAEYALASLVPRMTRDMRFVGWFYIIYGGLTCLSIIGAIVGIPMLISGLRLREAADEFEGYQRTNNFDAIIRGFERQGRFFYIQKIFVILMIVLLILYIILIIALVSFGLFSGMEDQGIAV